MWFFAPPSACVRLPCRDPFSCTYLAIGVEPTKETAATSRCSSMWSTAILFAVYDIENTRGETRWANIPAAGVDGPGSFSDGLSTKVLPQAMAIGNIHIGTIAGKLNGVIPATTPGLANAVGVDAGRDLLGELALHRWGMPHANSTTSMPR